MTRACAIALLVSGCTPAPLSDSGEFGELGRAQFDYECSGASGQFVGRQCSIAWPMMVGTAAVIDSPPPLVGPQRMPEVTASTSDPSIVAVDGQDVTATCECPGSFPSSECAAGAASLSTCEAGGGFIFRTYRFQVRAIASGRAFLVLTDTTGEVYDQLALDVRQPSQLTIEQQVRDEVGAGVHTVEVSSVSLQFNGSGGVNGGFWFEAPVRAQPRDADGNPLMATRIAQSIADVNVAAFDDNNPSNGEGFTSDVSVDVVPVAVGTTDLTVSAGNVSLTVPLVVR